MTWFAGIKGADGKNTMNDRNKINEEDNFCSHAPNKHLCLPVDYSKFELPHRDSVNIVEIGIDISDVLRINDEVSIWIIRWKVFIITFIKKYPI